MCSCQELHSHRAEKAHSQWGVTSRTNSNQIRANPLRGLQDARRIVRPWRLIANAHLRLDANPLIDVRDEAAQPAEKNGLLLSRNLAFRDVNEVERTPFVQCRVSERDGLVPKE